MRRQLLTILCLLGLCGREASAATPDPTLPKGLRTIMAAFGYADLHDAAAVESSGTGFLVHPDGFILCSHRIVDGADKVDVVLQNGGVYRAKILQVNAYKDLALLKIEAKGLAAAPLGDSEKTEVLETVVGVGFPLTDRIGSATASAFEGKIAARRDEKVELFQINAAANPGNSGGPLFNERGEVIGVVLSKLVAQALREKAEPLSEQNSFAIPLREARNLLKIAYPDGVPTAKSRKKLEPTAIFKKVQPATVLILNHGGAKPSKVAGGGQVPGGNGEGSEAGRCLVVDIPGLPEGAKKLELLALPGRGKVRPFFMGKYEVTQGQYEAVMGTNTSYFQSGSDYPVESVNWEEAQEFCQRLTANLPHQLKGKAEFHLRRGFESMTSAAV